MTEQPPSQQPAEEPGGDKPAAVVPDEAPTQVSSPEPGAASEPSATPDPPAAPERPAAPEPPAAFAPGGAPAGSPPAFAPPPPATELPSGDASEPSGLAAVFPPDHPERALGAAFAGGLVLALILKRLAH